MLSSTSNLPQSDDEKQFREELISNILGFRDRGNKKLGELVDDLYDASSEEEEEISQQQALLNQLCNLISDPATNRSQIIAFLSPHDIDINTVHSEMELRPIDVAAQSGSLDSFKFLFEDCQAEIGITPGLDVSIMTLIPSNNKEKINYFIQQKMWKKMQDGTTEILVAAWAGNLDKVKQLVAENPLSIFDINESDETVIDWADVANSEEIKLFVFDTISHINDVAMAKSEWHILRDMYRWYGIRYGYLKDLKFLDYFNHALDAHDKATVNNSIDIKDNIYRKKSSACDYVGGYIFRRYDPSFKRIEVEEVVDDADVVFANRSIKAGYIKKKFAVAINLYKDSLRAINCIANKSRMDRDLFITYRSSLVHIYMTLGLLYGEMGDLFFNDEMYEQTLEAHAQSKNFFKHALNIASNGTVFNNCADMFVADAPDVIKPLLERANEMLRVMDLKISLCQLEVSKYKKPKLDNSPALTSMIGYFTLWSPEQRIVEEKPDDVMEEVEEALGGGIRPPAV